MCLAKDTRVSLILIKIVQKGTKRQPFRRTYTSVVPPRRQARCQGRDVRGGEAANGKGAGNRRGRW